MLLRCLGVTHNLRTLTLGAIPIVLLGVLISIPTIPGTNVDLTVPYASQGPGPQFNTLEDGVITIEGAPTDPPAGNLNMTTVSVRTGMTLSEAMVQWLFTDNIVVPIELIYPKDRSKDEVDNANMQAFSVAESSATMAAARYLNLPMQVMVRQISEGSPAEGVVEPEDVLLSVAGTKVEGATQVRDLIQSHNPGDTVEVVLRRGDETITIPVVLGDREGTAFLGITMVADPVDVDITYNLQDIGGPSAGLIFSLAVVDKLSPGELNGGKKVAGTGTIDEDGTVGPIGGIVLKARGAVAEGMELFLVPEDNCRELNAADYPELTLAKVSSLDEAITQMDNYAAGRPVTGCS